MGPNNLDLIFSQLKESPNNTETSEKLDSLIKRFERDKIDPIRSDLIAWTSKEVRKLAKNSKGDILGEGQKTRFTHMADIAISLDELDNSLSISGSMTGRGRYVLRADYARKLYASAANSIKLTNAPYKKEKLESIKDYARAEFDKQMNLLRTHEQQYGQSEDGRTSENLTANWMEQVKLHDGHFSAKDPLKLVRHRVRLKEKAHRERITAWEKYFNSEDFTALNGDGRSKRTMEFRNEMLEAKSKFNEMYSLLQMEQDTASDTAKLRNRITKAIALIGGGFWSISRNNTDVSNTLNEKGQTTNQERQGGGSTFKPISMVTNIVTSVSSFRAGAADNNLRILSESANGVSAAM
ncbi:hypothetical protein [Zooshikella ganghwensis]|uniref:hypothetical protein n=1 Tax=Zooshikella ganghwensis TaxID=202772 RepID=UPI0004284DC5|nr:hypothetical protein [Zooshikella ganghwensis]